MKEEVRILQVDNETGLHCRPSASFVKVANQFQSDIFVEKNGEKVNGKSIIGLMMLAAEKGSQLQITAIGSDASDALDALASLDFVTSVENRA